MNEWGWLEEFGDSVEGGARGEFCGKFSYMLIAMFLIPRTLQQCSSEGACVGWGMLVSRHCLSMGGGEIDAMEQANNCLNVVPSVEKSVKKKGEKTFNFFSLIHIFHIYV